MTPEMVCPRCWGAAKAGGLLCPTCGGTGSRPDERLSQNFTLGELLRSSIGARRGLANVPDDTQLKYLRRLATVLLQPLRDRFGAVHVDSGLRVTEINALAGGKSTSAHLDGRAADLVFVAPNASHKYVIMWAISSGLPYDQIIYENGWVHVAIPYMSVEPRRMALTILGGNTSAFDPDDPRLV